MNNAPIRRPSAFNLLRFQLTGGLIVAGLLPYAITAANAPSPASLPLLNQSLLAVTIATTFGCWLLRNLITYPGVEKTSYILPSFAMAYGTIFGGLLLGRLEYSRAMLFSGFVLSIFWFYFIRIAAARRSEFRVAVTPFGSVQAIDSVPSITWVPFTDPSNTPQQIDAVAADLRMDMPDIWERTLADLALRGVPVYHIKHLRESVTGRVELEHISENNFGSLSPVSAYMTLKHLFDRIAALAALVAIAPLMVLLGVLIKLDSPGPSIFRQRRIGYQGRAFTVYKLRTMTVERRAVETERNAAMTKSADARVTQIGRFLRASRLDELPQLINVFKGEMSWIGPRPEAEVLSQWYETEIPFYRYRHIVRPGITGWAQVNQGHVSDVDDVKQKLNYDFYYIKNFSPWIDLLIVARTIRTMVTGFGSK